MQPMKINKELFELAQIRGTIDSDIEPMIFIDNKKVDISICSAIYQGAIHQG